MAKKTTAMLKNCKAVVIGGSAGSRAPMDSILRALPADYALPILVVRHLHKTDDGAVVRRTQQVTQLKVCEPFDKQPIEKSKVYVAPADYHMLVERDETISLSVTEKVNWSRPSIDVLFESAARAWGAGVIAIILSGASADGARGMQVVQALGGTIIAQDPEEAEMPYMPRAAIELASVDQVTGASQIGKLLLRLGDSARNSGKR